MGLAAGSPRACGGGVSRCLVSLLRSLAQWQPLGSACVGLELPGPLQHVVGDLFSSRPIGGHERLGPFFDVFLLRLVELVERDEVMLSALAYVGVFSVAEKVTFCCPPRHGDHDRVLQREPL